MTPTEDRQALDRYIRCFEQLDEASLEALAVLFTADARFKDPFNDVRGVDAIMAIFRHMFRSLQQPRFHIDDRALSGHNGYIHWQFDALLGNGRPIHLTGMSRVVFAADGRVREHIDYWDAGEQVYMHIPLLGGLLRLIQRKLRA